MDSSSTGVVRNFSNLLYRVRAESNLFKKSNPNVSLATLVLSLFCRHSKKLRNNIYSNSRNFKSHLVHSTIGQSASLTPVQFVRSLHPTELIALTTLHFVLVIQIHVERYVQILVDVEPFLAGAAQFWKEFILNFFKHHNMHDDKSALMLGNR